MGVLIAVLVIALWLAHIIYCLMYASSDLSSPLLYIHMFLQTYLFTGHFITAHDSMHGTVSRKKKINKAFGAVSLFLFAGMSYNKVRKNHMLHHKFPAEAGDPDFNLPSQNFIIWWLKFLYGYITVVQFIIMAAVFNILNIWFNQKPLILYWIIPAFLSTLQLFYFGTYLPHRYPHHDDMKPHNARSQKRNHIWAMVSCYFFGYHNEHHSSPGTPWWRLYRIKQE